MGGSCAGSYPVEVRAQSLPIIQVGVRGQSVNALVDTGCMVTLVSSQIVGNCEGENYIVAFDGARVKCRGRQELSVDVRGVSVSVDAIVSDSILSDIDLILGMDAIAKLGGVSITSGNKVEFGVECCGAGAEATLSQRGEKIGRAREQACDGFEDRVNELKAKDVEVIEDSDFKAVLMVRHGQWSGNGNLSRPI